MQLTTEILSTTEATENTGKWGNQGEFLQCFSVFRGAQYLSGSHVMRPLFVPTWLVPWFRLRWIGNEEEEWKIFEIGMQEWIQCFQWCSVFQWLVCAPHSGSSLPELHLQSIDWVIQVFYF